MSDRERIIEARQLLLMRAIRGEFSQAPAGEFEARWDALDPETPAPKFRSVMAQGCTCEACMPLWAADHERPVSEVR